MAQFESIYPVDLSNIRNDARALLQIIGEGDANGMRVGATVTNGGEVVTLGGQCVGEVLRADGNQVPLTGTITGNTAYVVLDQASCAVPGPIQVTVKWVSGNNKTTLVIAYGTVVQTEGGTIIQPSDPIPDIDDLLAEIENMRTATAAAEAAATKSMTYRGYIPEYGDINDYTSPGQWVVDDNNVESLVNWPSIYGGRLVVMGDPDHPHNRIVQFAFDYRHNFYYRYISTDAGEWLRVGLNSGGTITSSNSMDDYTGNGQYICTSVPSDAPSDKTGVLLVFADGNYPSNRIVQIYVDYASGTYIRYRSSGWSAWAQLNQHKTINTITVKDTGGSFDSVANAVKYVMDQYSVNPSINWIIKIDPGTYDIADDVVDLIEDGMESQGLWIPPNTKICGAGKDDTIIRFLYNGDSDSIMSNVSAFNMPYESELMDCTIVVKNIRYCIHSALQASGVSPKLVNDVAIKLTNVKLQHLGFDSGKNPSYYSPGAFGSGSTNGGRKEFYNCDFIAGYAPWFNHNRKNLTKATEFIFEGCSFVNTSITGLGLSSINFITWDDDPQCYVTLRHCDINKYVQLTVRTDSYGAADNHVGYYITSDGDLAVIEDKTNNAHLDDNYMDACCGKHIVTSQVAAYTPVARDGNINVRSYTSTDKMYGIALNSATTGGVCCVKTSGHIMLYMLSNTQYTVGAKLGWNGSAWVEDDENPLLIVGAGGTCEIIADTGAARYDEAQTLTDAQKATARGNIGAASEGDVDELKSQINKVVDTDAEDVDLDLSDASGNILVRFSDGHVATKNFDSRTAATKTSLVSRYTGKKISIIGDSIDTYDQTGYKIDGYSMYYPHLDVTNVNDTWWKKVLDASGATLEINASYSGSRVTNTRSGYPDFYDRVSVIGNPDIIFVTLGTNDSRNSISLGEYDFATVYTSLSEATFRTAYTKGVKALLAVFPSAEIICIAQQMNPEYKNSIIHIAKTLGVSFIDTSDYVGEDGVHPGSAGMRQIASMMLSPTDSTLLFPKVPADSKRVGDELRNVGNAVSKSVDFENSGLHFYVGANGVINTSANWNAVVVHDATRIKAVNGVLGTNSTSNLCVAFYSTNSPSSDSFISGLSPNVGELFFVDVPTNAECIAICTRPANYVDYYANVTYNLADIEAESLRELSTIAKYTTGDTLTVQFEQGTISSSDGTESANANRIRTIGYINTAEFSYATCDDNHKMWLYEYNGDHGFVKGTTAGTIQRIDYAMLDAETAFIRIVITNLNGGTAILPTDVTGFVCVTDMIGQSIVQEIYSAESVENMGAYPRPLFTVQDARVGSDNTIIGTKFVKFNDGSDDLTTTAGNLSYKEYGNGFDKAPTSGETWINHYFGHCNSVDYCTENGCLILGNGSGNYSLPGKIFIIPNFESVLDNAQSGVALTLQNTNAIVIDCSSYNLGSKFNVIWGEKNGSLNNIAYLITATFGKTTSDKDAGDIGVIRRLLLGMGSNQLTYGQFISGQSSDEFNGTFEILDIYTQDGTAYKDCCQGSCYYKGEIVCAIGHGKPILWRMNLTDGKIRRKVYEQNIYAGDGSVISSGASGACTDGERVFTGVVDVGVWALNL